MAGKMKDTAFHSDIEPLLTGTAAYAMRSQPTGTFTGH